MYARDAGAAGGGAAALFVGGGRVPGGDFGGPGDDGGEGVFGDDFRAADAPGLVAGGWGAGVEVLGVAGVEVLGLVGCGEGEEGEDG